MSLIAIPKFLQTEISIPKFNSALGLVDWMREGLVISLPKSVTHSGWRAKFMQIALDSSGQNSFQKVEQSRFGIKRTSKVVKDDATLPVEAIISPEFIFTSTVKLPLAAAKSPSTTIALRMNDISPIPVTDCAFAVHKEPRIQKEKLEVDVAITHKETLRKIRKRFDADRIIAVSTKPDENGHCQFTFEKQEKASNRIRNTAANAALLVSVFFVLFTSIDANLNLRNKNLEQYEAALLSELRLTAQNTALFNDIDPDEITRQRGHPTSVLISELQTNIATLPEGILIEHVTVGEEAVALSGYAPSTREPHPLFSNFTPTPSNRPGFDKFTANIERGTGQ